MSRNGLSPGICVEFGTEATRVKGGWRFSIITGKSSSPSIFHRADIDVPDAALLLCHRARAAPNSTFQRYSTSECGVGRSTTREAFPEAGPYRCVILDRDSKFDT